MKYTQKPISIFPNNVHLPSHEILHFVVISHQYKIYNGFQASPCCPYRVPDIATWSYQTRVFHLLITSWHIFPVHYFTLAPFFAFSLIHLSYINKSFLTRMRYLLPRAKFQRVTFFMKRSYLLPRENFKLPHLPNQAHWDPGICCQLRSSHIHSIHQKCEIKWIRITINDVPRGLLVRFPEITFFLDMGSASESVHYKVTSPFIAWVHTQRDPCIGVQTFMSCKKWTSSWAAVMPKHLLER